MGHIGQLMAQQQSPATNSCNLRLSCPCVVRLMLSNINLQARCLQPPRSHHLAQRIKLLMVSESPSVDMAI
eukprot:39840-Amphidinium_carterae.1